MLNFRDDAAAFRAFIDEHKQKVFNMVLNRIQHWEDAEEITQDVFVDVYRNASSFRGKASVNTWLYRITMNKCIDHLRRKTVRKKWKFSSNAVHENEAIDFYHPGIASENKEKAVVLFKAMRQLPEKQYTAWVLSEIENLSYQEISEVMNTSLSSVESLLFRARQNLRKILSQFAP